MKRSIRLISLLLCAVMLAMLIPVVSSAASVLDGKKILFFGDSLTEKGGSSRYTNLLATAFPNSTIINAGVSGNTTYQARLRFQTDVLDKDPDIVFICLGMNDAAVSSDGNNYKPIGTYRRNIQNFITALKAIDCDVVLMTPNPVTRTSGDYAIGNHVEYCDVLRELAVLNNIGLVDMYTVFKQNGYANSTYISDGLHQTAKGHQVYADHIAAHLKAVYDNHNKAILTVEYVTEGGKKIGSYNHVGAAGANVRITVPQIAGYTAVSTVLTTTLSTKTVQFTYSSAVEKVLEKVNAIDRSNYAERVLAEIDAYVALAKTETDGIKLDNIAKKLEYLITVTGETELIYTNYLAYETSVKSEYLYGGSDKFQDDNIRLSDGVKSSSDCENSNAYVYSVWQQQNPEIIFDLGSKKVIDTVRAYVAEGQMGISRPESIAFSVSDDGVTYTPVSAAASTAVVADGNWDTLRMELKATDPLEARYVKITLNAVTWGSKCVWVDEVEALLADTDAVITTPEPDPNPDTDPDTDPDTNPDTDPDTNPDPEPVNGIKGDVNMNGKIDARDYLLLKRAFFKTFTLQCADEIADINDNGKLDARDYLLLKRAFFKTYEIK